MHGDGVFTSEIGFIDIRVFAHATEDTDKVQTAVRNLLPEELAQTLVFQKTSLTASWKSHHPFYSQTNRQKDPSSSTGKNRRRLKRVRQGRVISRLKATFRKAKLIPPIRQAISLFGNAKILAK